MTVDYTFSNHNGYLSIEVSGTICSHKDMIEYATHINETAHRLNRSKILIQGSNLTMQLDAYDTLAFAQKMDEISLALKGLRLATVSSSKNAEARSFIETALLNRSVSYKVFTEVEDAIAYLLA